MNLETRISRLEKIEERSASPMHPFERVNRLFAVHEKWGGCIPEEHSELPEDIRNYLDVVFKIIESPEIPLAEKQRMLAGSYKV